MAARWAPAGKRRLFSAPVEAERAEFSIDPDLTFGNEASVLPHMSLDPVVVRYPPGRRHLTASGADAGRQSEYEGE